MSCFLGSLESVFCPSSGFELVLSSDSLESLTVLDRVSTRFPLDLLLNRGKKLTSRFSNRRRDASTDQQLLKKFASFASHINQPQLSEAVDCRARAIQSLDPSLTTRARIRAVTFTPPVPIAAPSTPAVR
jgi:hypothetical protein